jgi:hypothetical protein
VTGVSGLTQSTPLCITSLTFMADLHYWISGALDATQHGPHFLNHTYNRPGASAPQSAEQSIIPARSDPANAAAAASNSDLADRVPAHWRDTPPSAARPQ